MKILSLHTYIIVRNLDISAESCIVSGVVGP